MKKPNRIFKFLLLLLAVCILWANGMTSQVHAGKTTKAKYTVTLNKTDYTVKAGKTVQLKATLNKAAKKKSVVWKSSNTKVATVSSKGKVKGRKNGKATITATIKGTKVKATCKIIVGTPVSKVKLNKSQITLNQGKTYQLKATVSPTKASNKKVIYTSSNQKVAKVSGKGVVTAIGVGKADITATAADGSGKKAKCKVTVTKPAQQSSEPTNPQNPNTPSGIQNQVQVSNTTDLVTALNMQTVTGITYTSSAVELVEIPAGNYSAKTLVINAPKATFINHGSFKTVTIYAIADDTYVEGAVNMVNFYAPRGHIVVNENGRATINLSDGLNQTVLIENNGTVENINVPVQANLEIEGNNTVPVTLTSNAGGTNIVTSVPLNITSSATWNMTLLTGAENTTASVDNDGCLPSVSGVGSVQVTVEASDMVFDIPAQSQEEPPVDTPTEPSEEPSTDPNFESARENANKGLFYYQKTVEIFADNEARKPYGDKITEWQSKIENSTDSQELKSVDFEISDARKALQNLITYPTLSCPSDPTSLDYYSEVRAVKDENNAFLRYQPTIMADILFSKEGIQIQARADQTIDCTATDEGYEIHMTLQSGLKYDIRVRVAENQGKRRVVDRVNGVRADLKMFVDNDALTPQKQRLDAIEQLTIDTRSKYEEALKQIGNEEDAINVIVNRCTATNIGNTTKIPQWYFYTDPVGEGDVFLGYQRVLWIEPASTGIEEEIIAGLNLTFDAGEQVSATWNENEQIFYVTDSQTGYVIKICIEFYYY